MSPMHKSASGINSKDSSSSNLKHFGLDSASASREGSSSDIFVCSGGAATSTLGGLGETSNPRATFSDLLFNLLEPMLSNGSLIISILQ